MKRLWALLCGGLLLLMLLAACGEKDEDKGDAGTDRRMGVAAVATRTMDGTDKTVIKATVAAVILDDKGTIEKCQLDEIQFDVQLAGGRPQDVTDLTTKWEKGDAYMLTPDDRGAASELTTSWKTQVQAFCRWAEGKTAATVSGIAATDGKSSEIEGCDLIITNFIKAVREASDDAVKRSTGKTDRLSLALTATKSSESTDTAPQYDLEMAAVALDDQGKVTGCVTDTLQAKMTVTDGVFTTISGEMESKRDMGDDYGMKAASSIKKEWDEQADAFDRYVRGKTADEIAAIKLGSDGKADGISGCTIAVSDMLRNTVKAAKAG